MRIVLTGACVGRDGHRITRRQLIGELRRYMPTVTVDDEVTARTHILFVARTEVPTRAQLTRKRRDAETFDVCVLPYNVLILALDQARLLGAREGMIVLTTAIAEHVSPPKVDQRASINARIVHTRVEEDFTQPGEGKPTKPTRAWRF